MNHQINLSFYVKALIRAPNSQIDDNFRIGIFTEVY